LINIYFLYTYKGYISQTKKFGALGLPNYRSFSLEEIEEATNNFDTASLIGEDSYGEVCHCHIVTDCDVYNVYFYESYGMLNVLFYVSDVQRSAEEWFFCCY
jgi:hypothetical protein